MNITLIVASLGYFIDIFDVVLFSVVRVQSLRSFGLNEPEILSSGVFLLNMQMAGLLVGAILWGIWGDKRGRKEVLLGSILIYSLSNIGNAFVSSVPIYGLFRFTAGLGLAGEMGAAITMMCEMLPKEKRGYGTTIISVFGAFGAIAAALLGDLLPWRQSFLIAGIVGIPLLFSRVYLIESKMFLSGAGVGVQKGDLLHFLRSSERTFAYLRCILIGLPVWFILGILISFSPEIAKAIQVTAPVTAGKAVLFTYIGFFLGDLASGVLSQLFKTRKKIVGVFLVLVTVGVFAVLSSNGIDSTQYYWLCCFLGFAIGYWTIFATIASESFGTNYRSTITTTVPNFVRASTIPMTLIFRSLASDLGVVKSALIVGIGAIGIALLALVYMKETFGRDLDFFEKNMDCEKA